MHWCKITLSHSGAIIQIHHAFHTIFSNCFIPTGNGARVVTEFVLLPCVWFSFPWRLCREVYKLHFTACLAYQLTCKPSGRKERIVVREFTRKTHWHPTLGRSYFNFRPRNTGRSGLPESRTVVSPCLEPTPRHEPIPSQEGGHARPSRSQRKLVLAGNTAQEIDVNPVPGREMESWTSAQYQSAVAAKLDTFNKTITNASLTFYPYSQGERFHCDCTVFSTSTLLACNTNLYQVKFEHLWLRFYSWTTAQGNFGDRPCIPASWMTRFLISVSRCRGCIHNPGLRYSCNLWDKSPRQGHGINAEVACVQIRGDRETFLPCYVLRKHVHFKTGFQWIRSAGFIGHACQSDAWGGSCCKRYRVWKHNKKWLCEFRQKRKTGPHSLAEVSGEHGTAEQQTWHFKRCLPQRRMCLFWGKRTSELFLAKLKTRVVRLLLLLCIFSSYSGYCVPSFSPGCFLSRSVYFWRRSRATCSVHERLRKRQSVLDAVIFFPFEAMWSSMLKTHNVFFCLLIVFAKKYFFRGQWSLGSFISSRKWRRMKSPSCRKK